MSKGYRYMTLDEHCDSLRTHVRFSPMREPTRPLIQQVMQDCQNMPVDVLIPFKAWLDALVVTKQKAWYDQQRGVKVLPDGTTDTADL